MLRSELPAQSPHRRRLAVAVLFPILAMASAAEARAGHFRVENYSNQRIHIAIAFERGERVSTGWFDLEPTESRTFDTPDAFPMFFRIEQDQPPGQGPPRELTFNTRPGTFPAIQQRFEVVNAPDDPNIQFLRWGTNYEHKFNVRRGAPLPQGWGAVRYFQVEPGDSTLKIEP